MIMPAIARMPSSAKITFVGRCPGIAFIAPHVYRCMDYDSRSWHLLHLRDPDPDGALPISEADVAVIFHNDSDGSIKRNLNVYLPSTKPYAFPAFPAEGEKIHVALYLAQCLKSAGLPVDPDACIDEALKKPVLGKTRRTRTEGMVVFHPGSGSRRKNHPSGFWMDMMKTLRSNPAVGNRQFTVLLGPAEEHLLSFYENKSNDIPAQLVYCPSNEELLSLLSRAFIYIGHDSGVTHLSAMLGTLTIALIKTTPIDQWKPLGPAVRVVEGCQADSKLMRRVINSALTTGPKNIAALLKKPGT